MSKTGATDAQIDESCRRWWNEPPPQHQTKTWDETRGNCLGESRIRLHGRIAQYLVPPTHRIVAVDDLTALLDEIAYWAPMEGCRSESIAALDRVSALIGGE